MRADPLFLKYKIQPEHEDLLRSLPNDLFLIMQFTFVILSSSLIAQSVCQILADRLLQNPSLKPS